MGANAVPLATTADVVHVTARPKYDQPGALTESYAIEAGSVSMTTVVPAVGLGPRFVGVRMKPVASPTTKSPVAVVAMVRSAAALAVAGACAGRLRARTTVPSKARTHPRAIRGRAGMAQRGIRRALLETQVFDPTAESPVRHRQSM